MTNDITLETLPQAVKQLLIKVGNIERYLISKNTPPSPNTDQLLPIKQAAELLNLTVGTLYTKVHHRTIPFIKRAGVKKLFFSRKKLLEFINEGEQATRTEIKEQAKKSFEKK